MFKSNWYYSLTKPLFSPPNWIFAPVWAMLYLSMFIALVLYLGKYDNNKKLGYVYFIVQLVLNMLWSPVFFGMRNISLALLVVVLLDIFVFLTIKKFYSVSKISGIILIPYMLWILFATYLNIGYLVLNG